MGAMDADWMDDDSLTEEQIRAAMAADGMEKADISTSRPVGRELTAIRQWASETGYAVKPSESRLERVNVDDTRGVRVG